MRFLSDIIYTPIILKLINKRSTPTYLFSQILQLYFNREQNQIQLQHMSFQLSDDGIFQLTKILYSQFISENNLKKLQLDKLDQFKKLHIKPLYPHKQIVQGSHKRIEKYECEDYCCELDPGRFCCCGTKAPDMVYREFGLGVCLYIKFMKHLAVFLLFVALGVLAAIGLYEVVAFQTKYPMTESYQSAFFSTTIGIVPSQLIKCQYSKVQSSTATFNIQCPIGKVNLIGAVKTTNTLQKLLNCRQQHHKIGLAQYQTGGSQSKTSPNPSQSSITLTMPNSSLDNTYVSYAYQCVESQYLIGPLKLPSPTLLIITIGIDIFIIAMFVLFMISEHKSEEKEIQYFKTKELAVHDFTVKVGGFRFRRLEEEIDLFIRGYNGLRQNNSNGQGHFIQNIVQIKVPEIEEVKEAVSRRRQYYQQLYDYMQMCFFEENINVNNFKNSDDFIKKCYGNSQSPNYQQYKARLTQMIQRFTQSKKLKVQQQEYIQVSLLMVLTNPRHKKQMIALAKNNCCGHYLKMGDRRFVVSQPPVADMVIWDNKYKNTCMRVIMAWIITLGIVLCSYLLVAFAQFKKQQSYKNNKFDIQCSLKFSQAELQTWQQTLYASLLPQDQPQYTHCYCKTNYLGVNIVSNSEMGSLCSNWFREYVVFYSIPILISFGIVVYNVVVSRFFRVLSRFEGHGSLSSELYSYIIKRSFMLIMNMGLIIILLKMHYTFKIQISNLSFLFQGTYQDLTADWYLQIGVIIILTLAFNIVIPLFDMIFVSILKCLRKCWDRRCYCVKTSQKTKKGYIELYVNDVFPIEERYSDFIAMVLITLTFSAVMPILYIILFLSIWFTFICDKVLLFKVYQKPINYNEDIQSNVFKIVYIGLMVHCVTSAFILSQENLANAGTGSGTSRFNTILVTPYLIPYVVIFIILAIWAVFYSTIVSAISYLAKKCQKDQSAIYRSKLHQNYFKALNNYQINRLKLSVQLQLHNNLQHSSTSTANSIAPTKIICQNTLKKLAQTEKSLMLNRNNNNSSDNVYLIGRVGYDEMFDDEIFYRERKIKSLDYQFKDVFKKESMQGRNRENTMGELRLDL